LFGGLTPRKRWRCGLTAKQKILSLRPPRIRGED
jgi:hypothetical protein